MVTMVIITILATAVLFAMYGAQEAARASKTRSTINKLHAIVMDRWEGYRTRRVPSAGPATDVRAPERRAWGQLQALRELMRFELPDRYSDFQDAPRYLPAVPSAALGYRRAMKQTASDRFQGAECLYLIVAAGGDEESYLAEFRNNEIGDVDEDGMREFIDGWGRPIDFLRWAPGFVAPLSQLQRRNDSARPDPTNRDQFNPWGLARSGEDIGYALYPLIYSPGPDGQYGLITGQVEGFRYSQYDNNPFVKNNQDGQLRQMGQPLDPRAGIHVDNIHNHMLEVN